MGVATKQKCPEGENKEVWIEGFDACSESAKCFRECRYKKNNKNSKVAVKIRF